MVKNDALKEQHLTISENENASQNSMAANEVKTQFAGSICPNCGAQLEGRKCKLFCPTRGCGYLVTCSEW